MLNADTTGHSNKQRDFPPVHPGEVLLEEFLQPMSISQYRLAKSISVPQRRISEIVKGTRAITPDTALRFGLFFSMDSRFWLNLQSRHDLLKVEQNIGERLKQEIQPYHQDS